MSYSLNYFELFYIIRTITQAQKLHTELADSPKSPQKFHSKVKAWAKYLTPQPDSTSEFPIWVNGPAILPATQAGNWQEH